MGGRGGDSVKIQHGRKYTPLYEKGKKKDQNKSMETIVIITKCSTLVALMGERKNYPTLV